MSNDYAISCVMEFGKPRRIRMQDGTRALIGRFRDHPGGKPIRYYYYPDTKIFFVTGNDSLWGVYHEFRVERLGGNMFRLTPVNSSMIVGVRSVRFI